MTLDERILAILLRDRVSSSAALGAELDWHDRGIRRRLRRLIRDGYVFAPERGRYRLTAAGRAVMRNEEPWHSAKAATTEVGVLDMTVADVVGRWRSRE